MRLLAVELLDRSTLRRGASGVVTPVDDRKGPALGFHPRAQRAGRAGVDLEAPIAEHDPVLATGLVGADQPAPKIASHLVVGPIQRIPPTAACRDEDEQIAGLDLEVVDLRRDAFATPVAADQGLAGDGAGLAAPESPGLRSVAIVVQRDRSRRETSFFRSPSCADTPS